MQNQFGRVGGVFAFGTLLCLTGGSVSQAQSTSHGEHSLLGVTLLKSSFRDVLRRFGRPDEIQAGGPYLPSEGAPSTARASGGGRGGPMMGGPMMGGMMGMMGGPPGMGGRMAGMGGRPGGGGGNKAISKNGFPGSGGTGAAGPGAMMGGNPGARGPAGMPAGMMGGYPGMGGGLPGFSGGGSGMPGAMMGMMGGAPGGSGMMGAMMGMGGAPGAASGGPAAAEDQSVYETTWWYHDKANGLHKSFLFNKDGRVIQAQEYGYDQKHKGGKTSLGVGLGSGLNQVLRNYGWSNDGANDGRNMILRFGGEDKVAFQLVNNIVVGITVAVVKDVAPPEESQ